MSQITLEAQARDRAGKGVARTLRREGRVPAVIYGDKKEPVLISLDANKIYLEHRKGHMKTNLTNLMVDGSKHLVIAREIALHPVTDVVEHIDFLRVSSKTRVNVPVPVHVVGQEQSPGVKRKGLITYGTHEMQLSCPATAIPDFIEVDISALDIGGIVHAKDVKLPKDVSLAPNTDEATIVAIENPTMGADPAEAEAPAADAAAAAAEAPKA